MRHKWEKEGYNTSRCVQCGVVKVSSVNGTEYSIDGQYLGSKAGECTGEKPTPSKNKKKTCPPINAVMVPEIPFDVPDGVRFPEAKEMARKEGCNVMVLRDGRTFNIDGKLLTYPK